MKSRALLSKKRTRVDEAADVPSKESHQGYDSGRIASPHIPHEEWGSLGTDDRVTVQRGWASFITGSIDAIEPDRSVFWIIDDQGGGRIAIHSDDDIRVWRAMQHDEVRLP